MLRTVYYNGTEISYELTYKKVKNLNLRIKPDCSVCVSSSRRVPLSVIDDFVMSKGSFILNAISRYKTEVNSTSVQKQFISGEKFMLFGNELTLIVTENKTESVTYDDQKIYLSVKNSDDLERKQKLYSDFIKKLCLDCFTEETEKVYNLFRKYNVPFPELKIRTMKTKWGSCHTNKGIITLNTRLIEYPEQCIEYVVVHEFCHFIHPNHSKDFYSLLQSIMPDFKQRQKLLNE